MKFLIIGASSGLGRSLSEVLAASGHDLVLVASDERDLSVQCADLSLRYRGTIAHVVCHIDPRNQWLDAFKERMPMMTDLDGIFFPLGWSSDQDGIALDSERVDALVETNFSAIVKIVSLFLDHFLAKGRGSIVGFGSVASLRGRSNNVVYAAAKRALSSYFESLRHALANTAIRVQFYQLGYVDTPRNFGKRFLFPQGDVKIAAKRIVKNLDRDFGYAFFPRFWLIIQYIVRWLPLPIFKRLHF